MVERVTDPAMIRERLAYCRRRLAELRMEAGPTASAYHTGWALGWSSTLGRYWEFSEPSRIEVRLIRTPEVEAAYLERGRRKGWGQTWEEIEPRVAADIPIGRIVRREEVADLVLFLASPLSDAIHGQNIRIDGGALDVVN